MHPSRLSCRAIDDPGEDDNSEFWARYTVQNPGDAPDVVFTSEDYGETYARFLGCRHVMVDRERTHVASFGARDSGSTPAALGVSRALRSSLSLPSGLASWERNRPVPRLSLAIWPRTTKRSGCRSTAANTARRLQVAGVDLWTYQWRSAEFTEIARKQQEMEDDIAREANRLS